MKRFVLPGLSLLVGVAIGVAGAVVARPQHGAASLRTSIDCAPRSQHRVFLGPTGVQMRVSVAYRSSVVPSSSSPGTPKLEAVLSMPSRWTAYSRGTYAGVPQMLGDGTVSKRFIFVMDPGAGDQRLGRFVRLREGHRTATFDVIGPTDAAPGRFDLDIVMTDADGSRLVRRVEDPCPLPPGPLHDSSGDE